MNRILKTLICSIVAVIVTTAPTFALSEKDWDMYDLNNIYYYDPEGSACIASGSTSFGANLLYDGRPIIESSALIKIQENRPFYEKAASKYNIPWQIIATIHYREASLSRYNPANGQGAYQLKSYTNGGTNNNAFTPAGSISDQEFQRQTDIAAQLIHDRYGNGLNLSTDDGIKTLFFRYNGTADSYISQARDLGYSEIEANRGEGSPYVMNLADAKRDSAKNPNWRQISVDNGPMDQPAGQRPGAFVMYSALGGSTGLSYCDGDTGGSMDLNQTAISLAWPEHGHGLTARDSYKTALANVGLTSYGDSFVRIGASCDAFVATVFRYSGVDPKFMCCGISGGILKYVQTSSKFIEVPNRANSLRPGDIRISNGHVEMYIEVNGVGKIASASHGERTAEIGSFYENSSTFKAYRWVGN